MTTKLDLAHRIVRENITDMTDTVGKWYNKGVKRKEFTVGEQVYVYSPRKFLGRVPKWNFPYRTEGTVIKRFNDVTYAVQLTNGREIITHVDKLKRAVEPWADAAPVAVLDTDD
jgi:hypothetical protein